MHCWHALYSLWIWPTSNPWQHFLFLSFTLTCSNPKPKNWSLKVDIVYIWLSLLSLLCMYSYWSPTFWISASSLILDFIFILFFFSWIVRPALCVEKKNPPLVWRIQLLRWWKDMRSFKSNLIPLVKACLSWGIHASKGILCILAIP